MKEAEEEGAEDMGAAEGGWVAERGVVVVETKRKSEQWVLFCFLAKCLPVGLNFYPEYFCFNSVKCGLPKRQFLFHHVLVLRYMNVGKVVLA